MTPVPESPALLSSISPAQPTSPRSASSLPSPAWVSRHSSKCQRYPAHLRAAAAGCTRTQFCVGVWAPH